VDEKVYHGFLIKREKSGKPEIKLIEHKNSQEATRAARLSYGNRFVEYFGTGTRAELLAAGNRRKRTLKCDVYE